MINYSMLSLSIKNKILLLKSCIFTGLSNVLKIKPILVYSVNMI